MLCASFEVLCYDYRGALGEKRLPPFPLFFSEGSFWRLLSTWESSFRISPPLVFCRTFPSGGNLLLSEATLVRVVLEKCLPPS